MTIPGAVHEWSPDVEWVRLRTVWKGSLSFGLVNVPVSLVAATSAGRTSFRQLHDRHHAPVKYEKRCTECGEALSKDEIVKGVEVAKGRFVVVTEDELKAVEPESSRALTVRQFVDRGDVDPVYHDRSFALMPQPGGERAYALLFDALNRRNEVGIGKITLRNREHVVAIRPGERFLFADVLHYPSEVKDLSEIDVKVSKVDDLSDEEKQLADVLLDRLHKEWKPEQYVDEYEQHLRELIATKAEGGTYEAPGPKVTAPTKDLLEALRATLAAEGEDVAQEAG